MEENKSTEEVKAKGVGENVAPATETKAETKPELTEEQKVKLEQQRQFFYRLREGGAFLKFIDNDLKRQEREHLNRAQRRRFEKEIRKGRFSREIIEVYMARITEIEAYIANELNPKPVVEEVDGAKLIEQMRAKETETNKENANG